MNEKFIWHEGDIRLYHKDIGITTEQLAKANERIDDLIESIEKQKREQSKKQQSGVKTKRTHAAVACSEKTSKIKKPV
jgi:hypothetical protein